MRYKILVVAGLLVSFFLDGMEFSKIDKQLLKAAKLNKPLLLKWALWCKANPNVSDSTQATPLHYCASRNDIEPLQLLVSHGALVNAVTIRKFTPLHTAIAHQVHIHVVEWFLDHGAHVDVQDEEGNTPLHCAVSLHNEAVARLLVQRGALINLVNQKGLLPEHIDAQSMWNVFYALFKSAIFEDKGLLVDFLLSRGAQFDFTAPTGGMPMHWAAACLEAPKMVPLLLEHALQRCVEPQGPSKLLVMHSLLNMQDLDGQTPLHWAVSTGNFESWQLLLRSGARLDIQNHAGDTPLHLLALDYYEDSESEDSLDENTFWEFLNCPMGSMIELPSEVRQASDRIFTFLCCLHRIKNKRGGIALPTGIVYKILREYLSYDLSFVPLGSYYKNMDPALLITCTGFKAQRLLSNLRKYCILSNLRKYRIEKFAPIFPKLELLVQLMSRHQLLFKKILSLKEDETTQLLREKIEEWRQTYAFQERINKNYVRLLTQKR